MIMAEQTRCKEWELVFGLDNRGLRDNAGWLYHSGARPHYQSAGLANERRGAAGQDGQPCISRRSLLTPFDAARDKGAVDTLQRQFKLTILIHNNYCSKQYHN